MSRIALRNACMAVLLGVAGLLPARAAEPAAAPATPASAPAEAPPADAKPAPSVDQLHAELRKLKAEVEAAMNKLDIDGVLRHAHKDVVLTSLNAGGGRGHDQIRAYHEKLMKGPGRTVEAVSITFEPDELSILHGGDTAISRGASAGRYRLVGGAEYEIGARWTSTLVRENDRWLIASFHMSANLFDNPVLSAAAKVVYWAAGIALLVGLVAGVLIGRLRRKAA